jgi:hypothetical protein
MTEEPPAALTIIHDGGESCFTVADLQAILALVRAAKRNSLTRLPERRDEGDGRRTAAEGNAGTT